MKREEHSTALACSALYHSRALNVRDNCAGVCLLSILLLSLGGLGGLARSFLLGLFQLGFGQTGGKHSLGFCTELPERQGYPASLPNPIASEMIESARRGLGGWPCSANTFTTIWQIYT